jgi:hypothetical protein
VDSGDHGSEGLKTLTLGLISEVSFSFKSSDKEWHDRNELQVDFSPKGENPSSEWTGSTSGGTE